MTRVTLVSSDNVKIAAEHQEPVEVLSQLGNTSTPQISGSKSVASVAASVVLVAVSGVLCNSSLFFGNRFKQNGARAKASVSLINQVALVGEEHKAFSLQGRVVDVAHVGQAHPCHKSLTTK